MKVAYFTGPQQLEILDMPRPTLSRPDAVLLRIDRVGICGSDVHYFRNGQIGGQVLQYPATVGHECAGTVVEAGAEVQNVRPGDRVAVDPAMACGRCDQCRSGRGNTCRNVQFMGCPGQAPGAMAEYRVVPAANCFPIPATMTLDEAALVEPLSIGLYAVRLAGIAPAMRIVVLGAGPIGLSVLLCAKAAASCTVYVTDLLDQRLAIARRCGADWIGNPRPFHSARFSGSPEASSCPEPAEAGTTKPEPAEAGTTKHISSSGGIDVVGAIRGREAWGVDMVFECSGDPACIDQAQQLLTPGGTLMIVGIPSGDRVDFDPHRMRRSALTFKAVRRQNDCVAPMIDMVHRREIDPSPLLTHRFRLEQIREAFELVAGYRDGVIKAVLDLTDAK